MFNLQWFNFNNIWLKDKLFVKFVKSIFFGQCFYFVGRVVTVDFIMNNVFHQLTPTKLVEEVNYSSTSSLLSASICACNLAILALSLSSAVIGVGLSASLRSWHLAIMSATICFSSSVI